VNACVCECVLSHVRLCACACACICVRACARTHMQYNTYIREGKHDHKFAALWCISHDSA